jgi:hypothetical protein
VQHLRDFRRFEMNKLISTILAANEKIAFYVVAEEDILTKLKISHEQQQGLANQLGVSQFVVWRTLKEQGLHPKSSGTKSRRFTFDVSYYAFTHN